MVATVDDVLGPDDFDAIPAKSRAFRFRPQANVCSSTSAARDAAGEGFNPESGERRNEGEDHASMQNHPPLMHGIDGSNTGPVEIWDARAEADVAVLIRRYLADHPAPGPSRIQDGLLDWADQLEADGQARLEAQGHRRLRAA